MADTDDEDAKRLFQALCAASDSVPCTNGAAALGYLLFLEQIAKHNRPMLPIVLGSYAKIHGEFPTRRVRHRKRGTTYEVLWLGNMQTEHWLEPDAQSNRSVDMHEVVVYRSEADGSVWVRPRFEFQDGRFEDLPAEAPGYG